MSHRRYQKENIKTKMATENQEIRTSLDKLHGRIKNEKFSSKNQNQIKITLFAVVLIIITASTGFLIFSNLNITGTSSFKNSQGQTMSLPSNMPSRYDSTLTQNPKLKTAYQFASNHSEILSQLICYCGCNNPMHQPYHENNDQCFWTTIGQKKTHPENCSTCVYIALSAKTLSEVNWSINNIRAFRDSQYT